ncbi:unnamed protein product [Protopolystoma xenopodis]|uniref:Uncharacterized protein n=1 Tax=Protopolystoma xenopodis TaxID=117903 RepID=A0A448XBK1_9PLAT|nr:unnamed protein product [Protopolystoma xenopodis]
MGDLSVSSWGPGFMGSANQLDGTSGCSLAYLALTATPSPSSSSLVTPNNQSGSFFNDARLRIPTTAPHSTLTTEGQTISSSVVTDCLTTSGTTLGPSLGHDFSQQHALLSSSQFTGPAAADAMFRCGDCSVIGDSSGNLPSSSVSQQLPATTSMLLLNLGTFKAGLHCAGYTDSAIEEIVSAMGVLGSYGLINSSTLCQLAPAAASIALSAGLNCSSSSTGTYKTHTLSSLLQTPSPQSGLLPANSVTMTSGWANLKPASSNYDSSFLENGSGPVCYLPLLPTTSHAGISAPPPTIAPSLFTPSTMTTTAVEASVTSTHNTGDTININTNQANNSSCSAVINCSTQPLGLDDLPYEIAQLRIVGSSEALESNRLYGDVGQVTPGCSGSANCLSWPCGASACGPDNQGPPVPFSPAHFMQTQAQHQRQLSGGSDSRLACSISPVWPSLVRLAHHSGPCLPTYQQNFAYPSPPVPTTLHGSLLSSGDQSSCHPTATMAATAVAIPATTGCYASQTSAPNCSLYTQVG